MVKATRGFSTSGKARINSRVNKFDTAAGGIATSTRQSSGMYFACLHHFKINEDVICKNFRLLQMKRHDACCKTKNACETALQSDAGVVRWCWVNFQCRGVLLIWIRVGQGPTTLAVGVSGGCLGIFLSSIISLFFLPLSGRRSDIG